MDCGRGGDGFSARQCPAHTALIVRQFSARNSITVLEHPPYSPDFAPAIFSCSPNAN